MYGMIQKDINNNKATKEEICVRKIGNDNNQSH